MCHASVRVSHAECHVVSKIPSRKGKHENCFSFLSLQDRTCTQIHVINLYWFFLPRYHEVEHCCEQRGTQRYYRCLSLEWTVIFIQLQASSVVYATSSAGLKDSKAKAEMSHSLRCFLQHWRCWAGHQVWEKCEYCIFLDYQSLDVLNIDHDLAALRTQIWQLIFATDFYYKCVAKVTGMHR